MTSYILPEEARERRMIPYKTALCKLAPHQIAEKLLVFKMAARSYFWSQTPSSEIINRLGREEATKLNLEEFLEMVKSEMPSPISAEQIKKGLTFSKPTL